MSQAEAPEGNSPLHPQLYPFRAGQVRKVTLIIEQDEARIVEMAQSMQCFTQAEGLEFDPQNPGKQSSFWLLPAPEDHMTIHTESLSLRGARNDRRVPL